VSKKKFIVIIILLLAALSISGCSGNTAGARNDEPTDVMAWQFAQGLVRPQVPRAGNATFPRFEGSFVEQNDNGIFVIASYVNTLNSEGAVITYNFIIEAEYVGNDVFQEITVELRKN
jgi:PBP1b-binding outer membrane lipoprotein LpoB